MNKINPGQSLSYADALRGTRRVFVRELEIMASIGVFDHEKRRKQRIIVSVDLMVDDDYDGILDDLGAVLDYADVVGAIRACTNGNHVNLIETLAQSIAQRCLRDARVFAARVKIEKPDPFADAGSVGIEIERLQSVG